MGWIAAGESILLFRKGCADNDEQEYGRPACSATLVHFSGGGGGGERSLLLPCCRRGSARTLEHLYRPTGPVVTISVHSRDETQKFSFEYSHLIRGVSWHRVSPLPSQEVGGLAAVCVEDFPAASHKAKQSFFSPWESVFVATSLAPTLYVCYLSSTGGLVSQPVCRIVDRRS